MERDAEKRATQRKDISNTHRLLSFVFSHDTSQGISRERVTQSSHSVAIVTIKDEAIGPCYAVLDVFLVQPTQTRT